MAGTTRLEPIYHQDLAGACQSEDGCAEHGCIAVYAASESRHPPVSVGPGDQAKADTHSSVGNGGLSPKQFARLTSRAIANVRTAAVYSCGPRSDADEVEWFLSMLPASACTSGSSDIMRDLRGRGPSLERPAHQLTNRDDQSEDRARRGAELVAHTKPFRTALSILRHPNGGVTL